MTKQKPAHDLGLFVLRVALGLYLLIAGIGKVQGEFKNGFGSFYRDKFAQAQPDWLPEWFGVIYGYPLPFLELLAGGLLILGLFGRITATIGTLMLLSFTIMHVIWAGNITGIAEGEQGVFHNNYIHTAGWLAIALVGCGGWSLDRVVFKKRKKA